VGVGGNAEEAYLIREEGIGHEVKPFGLKRYLSPVSSLIAAEPESIVRVLCNHILHREEKKEKGEKKREKTSRNLTRSPFCSASAAPLLRHLAHSLFLPQGSPFKKSKPEIKKRELTVESLK